MGLKTNLPDDKVLEAAQRIRSGESWALVSRSYDVNRWKLWATAYGNLFKCQGRKLQVPEDPAVLAYIAGLLDGEGSIATQNARWNVAITNTYRPLMDWLELLGGKTTERRRKNPNHLTCYYWRVHAQQDVLALLEALVPYMIVKRELALHVIEEIGHRPYRKLA